jgi:uncharacterized protein (TIGR03083 family)
MRLAATEYQRLQTLLAELSAEEWTRPTECVPWDVRAVAGHCVGMARMSTGLRETLRQTRAAKRRGGVPLDALTALQVAEQAQFSTGQLVDELGSVGRRASRARRQMPAPIRWLPLAEPQDVGGRTERWSIGYLNDTILTRDPWMHRMDVCRATGRTPYLTIEHDAVLVADVVAEWADRHGQPYTLMLDGPAGGRYSRGSGGPELQLGAVDFCRLLSGRTAATDCVQHPLLDISVPF